MEYRVPHLESQEGPIVKTCSCGKPFFTEVHFLTGTSHWQLQSNASLSFRCQCQKTLILEKNQFHWYADDPTVDVGQLSLFNFIHNKLKIPYETRVLTGIQVELSRAFPNLEKIADHLKQDPLFAAQLFEQARGRSAGDIDTYRDLASWASANEMMALVDLALIRSSDLVGTAFTSQHYFEDASEVARFAVALAEKCPERVSIFQLSLGAALCNLGKWVVAAFRPGVADHIMQIVNDPKQPVPWLFAERKVSPYNHCIVGEVAGALWGLPNFVRQCIRKHHTIGEGSHLEMFELVGLANQLYHREAFEDHLIDESYFKNLSERALSLGIDVDHVD